MRTNGQKKKAKRRPALPRSQNLTSQRCQFCGCTDSKPCAGGCAWAQEDVCTTCARTFSAGELNALSRLIAALEKQGQPSVNRVALIDELKTACEAIVEQIAQLSANWPDAIAPPDTVPMGSGEQEFGKGTRSVDTLDNDWRCPACHVTNVRDAELCRGCSYRREGRELLSAAGTAQC